MECWPRWTLPGHLAIALHTATPGTCLLRPPRHSGTIHGLMMMMDWGWGRKQASFLPGLELELEERREREGGGLEPGNRQDTREAAGEEEEEKLALAFFRREGSEGVSSRTASCLCLTCIALPSSEKEGRVFDVSCD